MRRVAERLGLTRDSLWSHLLRAKRDQNEPLFDWEPQCDSNLDPEQRPVGFDPHLAESERR